METAQFTSSAEDPSSAPPERYFVTRLGNTALYVSTAEEPWKIAAQALVLPTSSRARMKGRLATAYFGMMQDKQEELRYLIQSMVESSTKPNGLQPGFPVLITLPDWVTWPKPPKSAPQATDKSPSIYVIAATAYEGDAATTQGAARAAEAIVHTASKEGISHLTLPLLGAGKGGLAPAAAMRATTAAVQTALLNASPNDWCLAEITLVTQDSDAAAAAFDFFSRRAQRPLNDLPDGRDLLNVAIEARALAETLLLRDLQPPLSVGIIGGWGSGKSFIMHLMQERMTELRTQRLTREQTWPLTDEPASKAKLFPYVGHVYQISFDAWTYAKGDLWSSLMQTIFFELNRQITLEKRLREANDTDRFLLEGGECWRALNAMGDEARDLLLRSHLAQPAYEKWKRAATGTMEDVLWQELIALQEEQRKRLQETIKDKQSAVEVQQETLRGQERQRAAAQAKLQSLVQGDLMPEAQADALRQAFTGAARTLGTQALAQLQTELQAATSSTGKVTAIDFDAIRPNRPRIFLEEMLRSPEKLRWFLLLAWLGTVFFVLAAVVHELIPQMVGIVLALGSYLAAGWRHLSPWLRETLKKLQAWNDSIQSVYQSYKQTLERRHAELKAQQDAEITRLHGELVQLQKQMADSQQNLAKLQADLEQHRRQLGPIASYDSLLEFVHSRLNDTYEQKLGFVHLVQRDLRELTNSLVANTDKPERVPQRLRELLARGPARIVLFIDDLDRCPPDQVVQVLEAAQLLLKTELFVVVMAIDVRYVARALEKAYDKILVRRGRPSGLDYIEKIIQIPYRVRPIEPDALEGYLRAQIQVERPTATPSADISRTRSAGMGNQIAVTTVPPATKTLDIPPSQVLEFSTEALNDLLTCCRLVDLSPRAIKRLVNVSKIIKVVWFRSQYQASPDANQGVFALLALSDRFPDLMRDLFEDLAAHFRLPNADVKTPFRDLINRFTPPGLTDYQKHEWTRLLKLVNDTDLLPEHLSPDNMGLQSFNLVRSFCFVGDIGYDPHDENKNTERTRI